jgi:hypothetical protein
VGIREEVARLVNDRGAQHKRLIEYVVRQVKAKRTLADVLEDPYVVNRSTALERRALLEEPEIVDAVSEDVLETLRRQLEAIVGG